MLIRKNKLLKTILFIVCLFIVFHNLLLAQDKSPVQAEDTNKILEQITEKLNRVKSLKANFIQVRHLSVLVQPLISEGLCFFEKPDRLRWEIKKPYQSILIYNKSHLGKFDVQEGKLRKLNLGTEDLMREILKQIISWMQGNFEDAKKIYDIHVYNSGAVRLLLVPKSEALQKNIRSIELQFTENLTLIRSVKIIESDTDFIDIQFNNVKQNSEINPGLFDIKKPEIIRQPSK